MSESGMDGSDALQAGQVEPSALSSQRPGARLATQREALGWSIEHVANQLNLAPRQVQALENDDYAALPGLVIARGFVRSYAKLLKIDAAPLVASMEQEPALTSAAPGEMRRALPASFTESKLQTRRSSFPVLLIALAVVAIGIAGWFAYQNQWFAGLPAMIQAQGEQPALPTSAETPTAQGDADAQSQVDENVTDVADENQAAEAALDPVTTPPVPKDGAAQAASPAVEEKPANPAHNLILKVREESWIEIKREDGTTMVGRLMPAGTTESFAIRRPALLVVGNASGVDVTYRGKPLDLTTAAKSNVARLNLQHQ